MKLDNFKLKALCNKHNFNRDIFYIDSYENPFKKNNTINYLKLKYQDSYIYFKISLDNNNNEKSFRNITSMVFKLEREFKDLLGLSFCRQHEQYISKQASCIFGTSYMVYISLHPREVQAVIRTRIYETIRQHKGSFVDAYNDFANNTDLKKLVNDIKNKKKEEYVIEL